MSAAAKLWDKGWFLFPNPVYGPWDKLGWDDAFPSDKQWEPNLHGPRKYWLDARRYGGAPREGAGGRPLGQPRQRDSRASSEQCSERGDVDAAVRGKTAEEEERK